MIQRSMPYGRRVCFALLVAVGTLVPIQARTPVVLGDWTFQRFGSATLAVYPAVALTASASTGGSTWDDAVVTIWYNWTVENPLVPDGTVVPASVTASMFVTTFAGNDRADARAQAQVDVRSPVDNKLEIISCANPGGGACAKAYSGTIHLNAVVGWVHTIRLDLNSSAINGASASGYIDPHFFIDASVPNSSQYKIRLSAGVSNTLPVPAITSITPTPIVAGQNVTLTVKGTGFLGGVPVVRVAGQPMQTTFVNGGELQAVVPAAALCPPGPCAVTVDNPSPGGGLSDVSTFAVRLPTADLVQNGDFSNGTTGWTGFATPDPSYLVWSMKNGVAEFTRSPPPAGTANQATIFEHTGSPVAAGTALLGQFDLGNSSSVRKRISVLVLDSNFSDLSVCTFWLPPNSPLRTYGMRMHSTQAWTNAAIYFYAATAGTDGGAYRVDNVMLQVDPSGDPTRTACIDPKAPVIAGGANGGELLVNGDFGNGAAGWSLYGQLTQQVNGGVFEFYRPAATPDPAGVILQPTGAAVAPGQAVTARFDLGNSSAVRKRVTILLHDLDFSDLSACTFFVPPGQALSAYAMRAFATKAWANATISLYAATAGDETWTRLDNVSLRTTPAAVTSGTDCAEPGGNLPSGTLSAQTVQSSASPSVPTGTALGPPTLSSTGTAPLLALRAVPETQSPAIGEDPGWMVTATETTQTSLTLQHPIDLRDGTTRRLRFRSWLASRASQAVVQVSSDGALWQTVSAVPTSDVWTTVDIDLSAFAGQTIWIRFAFDAVAPGDGEAPDQWRIDQIEVNDRPHFRDDQSVQLSIEAGAAVRLAP